jgi:hypothetical protein
MRVSLDETKYEGVSPNLTAIVGLIDPFFHNVEHSTGLAR